MARAQRSSQSGFTLVEMLISITLISLLSLIIANFVADWLRTASLSQARTTLLSNAQQGLDAVSTDIRLSGGVDLNNRWADANAPGGSQYGWTSGSSILVLAKVAVDSSNDVIFSDPAQYITEKDNIIYYVSGNKLYRRVVASDDPNTAAITTCPPALATASCPADKKVAEDVTAFSVSYYDANDQAVTPDEARAVQLAITLSATVGGEETNVSYTTRMVFRNE